MQTQRKSKKNKPKKIDGACALGKVIIVRVIFIRGRHGVQSGGLVLSCIFDFVVNIKVKGPSQYHGRGRKPGAYGVQHHVSWKMVVLGHFIKNTQFKKKSVFNTYTIFSWTHPKTPRARPWHWPSSSSKGGGPPRPLYSSLARNSKFAFLIRSTFRCSPPVFLWQCLDYFSACVFFM